MAKTPTSQALTPGSKTGAEKPEVDHALEDLMSEIESDIREDELKKLWTQYSGVIIAFAVALVLGVAGFEFWRQYEARTRVEAAAAYYLAAKDLDAGATDKAIAGFTDVAGRKLAGGYTVLARLGEAAGYVKKGDEPAAVKVYTSIAADTSVDPVFRDLGTVLRVMHSMDTGNPKELEALLAPVTDSNNAFTFSALELSALLSAKQGNTDHAYQLVQRILGDPTAPTGVRQRATDLAGLYKPVTPPTATAAAAPAADMPAPVPVKPEPKK